MRQLVFFVSLSALLVHSSCVKNNREPAWLEVNEWQLEDNPFASTPVGELTHDFSNAWVYVDNEFIGIFEMPFKIPILKEGWKKITLYPTVLNNGISATKKIYPFVESYEIEANLIRNQVTTINPVTRYKANTTFTVLDFESANLPLNDSPLTPDMITGGSDFNILGAFNGEQYGLVELNSTHNQWISATDLQEILPQQGAEVYLEVDVYCTEDVLTGVLAINSGGSNKNSNVQVNEQSPEDVEWRKMYIELTTIISGSQQDSDFEHTFEAKLDEGKESAIICLDNIKIVRF